MSKKTEKVENPLNEDLMRQDTKKRMEKLYREVKAGGGDIGMKVRKDEQTKEDKMPNAYYMDNPFGSGRKLDTFESFQEEELEKIQEAGLPTEKTAKQMKKLSKEANKGKKKGKKDSKTKDPLSSKAVVSTYEQFKGLNNPTRLEDMYSSRFGDSIDLNDDSWVRGTKEDFERPMFKNLPDHKDRHAYDVLRSGKFIETKDGKIIGQIDTIKGKVLTVDIIDEDDKHQTIEIEIKKLIKNIVNQEVKITDNSKSKNIKIDTPFGTKFNMKESE